ncbi:twin-arginine translocase TatA/TatE family subunit [Cohnella massiliensis]|uniref:twin-arginine translocase TatA/TatE family subunit n=1 Tax=Cohnella massiliensis TaxID=1816691 RepID=UPI0009B96C12|nr:twin-arginine translocase TatA/TatE family subunit [Cohnella massiliensis]
MPTIGVTGIILLVAIALLLFGPKKLPELGRAVGTTIREFRSGSKALLAETDKPSDRDESKSGNS